MDVYALGVVAYEMLTGRVPFQAETPLTVLHAHAHEAPPDPSQLNQALDESIAAVVLKALEKAPAERYQSAGAFARALRRAWKAAQDAAQAQATLAELYAQVQEALKADRWGVVVSLCVEMGNINPNYRDVGTLLTLAANRLAEEEQKRQQERELGEQYVAALELLEAQKYAEAVDALEKIADQAPDFRDVGKKLAQARAGLERARLYQAALAKLADECPDKACADLLTLLELDPDHADARARLLEAVAGLLVQLNDARAELERVGAENKTLRTRVPELEAQLKEAQTALKKLEPEAEKLRSALKTAQWVNPQDGKDMVRVPAGEFLYGDEKEKRELREFWIDKTPVTKREFSCFVEATGYQTAAEERGSGWVWTRIEWKETKGTDWRHPGGPKTTIEALMDHPVVQISWHDAVAYAEWAGKRLPSEEEWEKAARGTDGWEYPWGDEEPAAELCNFGGNEGGTTSVGKYSPQGDSPYGCVDMAGNVWEWTASDHESGGKVLRGGSWFDVANIALSANRYWILPDGRYYNNGFRCARGSE